MKLKENYCVTCNTKLLGRKNQRRCKNCFNSYKDGYNAGYLTAKNRFNKTKEVIT